MGYIKKWVIEIYAFTLTKKYSKEVSVFYHEKKSKLTKMVTTGFGHSPQCDIKLHFSKFELFARDKNDTFPYLLL